MRFDLLTLGDHLPDPHTGAFNDSQAQRYRIWVEMGVLAEQLGFSRVLFGEHHGSSYICPSPQMILAALAEDFATLDVLSDGRAEIGFGAGFTEDVFRLFGQALSGNEALADENLALIHRLFVERPLSWSGRFRAALHDFQSPLWGATPPTSVGYWLQPSTRRLVCNLGKMELNPLRAVPFFRGYRLMAYSKGCHTTFHHRYHIVWAPKYRYKVLHGEVRLRVREIIRQVCGEMDVIIINGVLSRDHVHMFVEIPPHIVGQRLCAPGKRALVTQNSAGVRTHPQTLLGAAVLGQGILLHNLRQHHR